MCPVSGSARILFSRSLNARIVAGRAREVGAVLFSPFRVYCAANFLSGKCLFEADPLMQAKMGSFHIRTRVDGACSKPLRFGDSVKQ